MTDHPRFQQVKDPPATAHRGYYGGHLVDLVFWLVDRWQMQTGAHRLQAARRPVDSGNGQEAHLPDGAAALPHATPLEGAQSRLEATKTRHDARAEVSTQRAAGQSVTSSANPEYQRWHPGDVCA